MGIFFFLTQFFIKYHRFHYRACRTDRSCNISNDRHIQIPRFQNADCIQYNLGSPGIHIHRPDFLPFLHRMQGIFCHMRLMHPVSHCDFCTHGLCLDRHAEWNTYILKTAIFIIGLCKIRHHLCIQMCFRPCNPRSVHQICRDHIHHSARTDAWRPICRFMM